MALIIGQINLNRSRTAVAELNRQTRLDVVLITEPYVYKEKVRGLEPSSAVVAKGLGPRACIRTRGETWPVEAFSSRDLAVAAIRTGDKGVVYFASAYMDIGFDITKSGVWKLVEWCEESDLPQIIGMDANAHSPLWGSGDLNRRGEVLEEHILQE